MSLLRVISIQNQQLRYLKVQSKTVIIDMNYTACLVITAERPSVYADLADLKDTNLADEFMRLK